MSIAQLVSAALSLCTAQNPDPGFAVTAHPVGLLALPLLGDETETFTHAQFDVVRKPAARLSPVAHLALSRLMADIDEAGDFEKSSIDRWTVELGARYRVWPERGWYAEGTLGWLVENYDSRWSESSHHDFQARKDVIDLMGKVDNTFQQPYAMVYLGWASHPGKRLRWDLGLGLGYALLGGTEDLHDITWTGNTALADPDQSVDLFAASPIVFDLNLGLGVNF